jgi:hypothetical protein
MEIYKSYAAAVLAGTALARKTERAVVVRERTTTVAKYNRP